jgi:hypothetical protein
MLHGHDINCAAGAGAVDGGGGLLNDNFASLYLSSCPPLLHNVCKLTHARIHSLSLSLSHTHTHTLIYPCDSLLVLYNFLKERKMRFEEWVETKRDKRLLDVGGGASM